MNEQMFMEANMQKWSRLEDYNRRLYKKGLSRLPKDEIDEFAELLHSTSYSLSYARTHFKDRPVTNYLNTIVGAANSYFYVKPVTDTSDIKNYFKSGFPTTVRENSKFVSFALILFLMGFLGGLIAVLVNPESVNYFFPGGINLSFDGKGWNYPFISSLIMANNIKTALAAIAFGVFLGLGTVYVLFYNGLIIGCLTGYVIGSGADIVMFASLILPHGFLELTAIFISGAAGLIIGRAILIPGDLRRRDSLIKGGKEAARLIPGIVFMLVIAAIIEGFFTPLSLPAIVKLVFAVASLGVMLGWLNIKNA